MNVDTPYLAFDGCWVWNSCVQGSWYAQRRSQHVSRQELLLPDPVTFSCDPADCCCTDGMHSTAIAPGITGAPWFDPHSAASAEFFGLLDENFVVSPIASTEGGGWEMVVVARAIASTTAGLERGLHWLSAITKSCSTAMWRQHCNPTQVTTGAIADDGWRTACNLRRVGEMASSQDEWTPGVYSARITMTFRSDSCIVGSCLETPATPLATTAPVARELCIPSLARPDRSPSWLQRKPRMTQLATGRWTDPWSVWSPPAAIVSPPVPSYSSIAWDVRVASPTENLYNLRLEIVDLDIEQAELDTDPAAFRGLRRRWTALVPEVPAGAELRIGAHCGDVSAWFGDERVTAASWLRSGSAGPYSTAPVVATRGCAQRFGLVAWASAERGPNDCRVTPCDSSIAASVRNVYRPAS